MKRTWREREIREQPSVALMVGFTHLLLPLWHIQIVFFLREIHIQIVKEALSIVARWVWSNVVSELGSHLAFIVFDQGTFRFAYEMAHLTMVLWNQTVSTWIPLKIIRNCQVWTVSWSFSVEMCSWLTCFVTTNVIPIFNLDPSPSHFLGFKPSQLFASLWFGDVLLNFLIIWGAFFLTISLKWFNFLILSTKASPLCNFNGYNHTTPKAISQ